MFGGAHDDQYDDGMMGPTWRMEDIQSDSSFTDTYQCASASTLPAGALRDSVEYGNKIVMPASALDILSRLNVVYPMMFHVTSDATQKSTFCGVLEFSASEGVVYLPPWMMKGLQTRAGDLVTLTNVALPVGNYIKIQPQSVDFLDITDPRAVLEHALRNFATLTVGDCVAVNYNKKIYELAVLEAKPNDGRGGICVLETDLQVEFAPPVGYQEPTYTPTPRAEKSLTGSLEVGAQLSTSAVSSTGSSFTPFSGAGQRLNNQSQPITMPTKQEDASTTSSIASHARSTSNQPTSASTNQLSTPAPIALPKGTLFFGSSSTTKSKSTSPTTDSLTEKPNFVPFGGQARKL